MTAAQRLEDERLLPKTWGSHPPDAQALARELETLLRSAFEGFHAFSRKRGVPIEDAASLSVHLTKNGVETVIKLVPFDSRYDGLQRRGFRSGALLGFRDYRYEALQHAGDVPAPIEERVDSRTCRFGGGRNIHSFYLLPIQSLNELNHLRDDLLLVARRLLCLESFRHDEGDEVIDAAARGKRRDGGQGYAVEKATRDAIEWYAMDKARMHFEAQGWTVDSSVTATRPYDRLCTRPGSSKLHVEVKGTRSGGATVRLTRGEVRHARQYPHVALFVVAGIKTTRFPDGSVQSSGGETACYHPWQIDETSLDPTEFEYAVPPLVASSSS